MKPKSEVCRDCASWKLFGEKCWFFWEDKKECSQFRDDEMSEPRHRNTRIDLEQMLEDLVSEK